jgi:hypothetical protein
MLTLILLLVVLALGSGVVVAVNGLLRADTRESEPELGSESWRPVNAVVVSVLRAGDRTFLQVRYRAGTSLILNDVPYPARSIRGPLPIVGQRVPIRYDPAAPARAVYDRTRSSGTPPRRPGPDRAAGPNRPVPRRPLTKA